MANYLMFIMSEEFKKSIVQTLAIIDWLQFLKGRADDAKILIDDTFMTPQQIERLHRKFADNDEDAWKRLNQKLMYLIEKDLEYEEWIEQREYFCESCSNFTLGEEKKLSKYHPKYEENNFNLFDDNDDTPVGVYMRKCSFCGHEEIYCTGVDENPEEGLR